MSVQRAHTSEVWDVLSNRLPIIKSLGIAAELFNSSYVPSIVVPNKLFSDSGIYGINRVQVDPPLHPSISEAKRCVVKLGGTLSFSMFKTSTSAIIAALTLVLSETS